MKIGIVGAENSHTAAIAHVLNVDRAVRGFSVDCVWGETPAAARKAAKYGKIPHIVTDPKQMLDQVDAIVVDHRHPRHHLQAARPFIAAGLPTFIDKPFCWRSREGEQFLAFAGKHRTPVTSFSTLPFQRSAGHFKRKMADLGEIRGGAIYGPCDPKSPWGGIFFYGIHHVQIALHLFGEDVSSVLVTRNRDKKCTTGQLLYSDGKIVTLAFLHSQGGRFAMMAAGANGLLCRQLKYDKNIYLAGIRTFTRMFRTGVEPVTHDRILKPIRILEALNRSMRSKQTEKIL